jgi:hypothetical protein
MATFTIQDRSFSCPVELAVSVIEGKWKVLILWNLRDATLRYSEIRDAVGDISDKMLAQQLQGLERPTVSFIGPSTRSSRRKRSTSSRRKVAAFSPSSRRCSSGDSPTRRRWMTKSRAASDLEIVMRLVVPYDVMASRYRYRCRDDGSQDP